jgi:Family of unknown function (DUF6632)
MTKDETRKLAALAVFLRIYGVVSLVLFSLLFVGFTVQTPLLADRFDDRGQGALNWLIWNGVRCGGEMCHVPPMLFVIYLTWGAFFLRAARRPLAYKSFLDFTMWANLVHALLMAVQALMDMGHYWSKWFTDIPFTLFIAVGIYLWRPSGSDDDSR